MKNFKFVICLFLMIFLIGISCSCSNEQGPQGIQGEQGPQGIQGEQGPQGIQGEQGPQGIQGEQGPQGIQGEQGPQGIQGEQGPQGIQGEQGPQGIQGEQGPQGIQGENGKDGTSLLTGNGKPSNELGTSGDSYIDLDCWDFYVKTNLSWILKGNIKADSKSHNGTDGLEFYPLNDYECAVIVGNAKLLSDIIIPSKYKEYNVTTIYGTSQEDSAFSQCTNLKSIVIPDSVTSIGAYAFYGCTSLTNIKIPDSVTTIGEYAFYGCTSLTNIKIPNSVTELGTGVFKECSSLDNVELSENITKISFSLFYDCTSLEKIKIPEGVTIIENYAFKFCGSLKKILLPKSLKEISDDAFDLCDILSDVLYTGSVEEWKNITIGRRNDCLTYIYRIYTNVESKEVVIQDYAVDNKWEDNKYYSELKLDKFTSITLSNIYGISMGEFNEQKWKICKEIGSQILITSSKNFITTCIEYDSINNGILKRGSLDYGIPIDSGEFNIYSESTQSIFVVGNTSYHANAAIMITKIIIIYGNEVYM